MFIQIVHVHLTFTFAFLLHGSYLMTCSGHIFWRNACMSLNVVLTYCMQVKLLIESDMCMFINVDPSDHD